MPNQDWWVVFKTKKEGNAPKELAGELQEVKKGLVGAIEGFTGMSIAGLGVAGVIAGVGKGLKDAMDETVAYASQVRDLGRISGASSEETSRLIQTADDLKIEYGTLEQAAKALAHNGIALTTEELAKSSDEYLSYSNAGDRAEYAVKKFGKAGLELTKVLEVGGDTLREMAAAQEDALILTDKQVETARDFEKAQDAVNDTLTGFKYAVGNAVLPAINAFLKGIDDLLNKEARLKEAQKGEADQIKATAETYPEYFNAVQAHNVEAEKQIKYGHQFGYSTSLNIATIKIMTMEEWNAERATKAAGIAAQVTAAGFDEFESSVGASSLTTKDFAKILKENLAANLVGANTVMQQYTEQLFFNKAAEGLDADAALILAEKMGLVYGSTAEAMKELALLKLDLEAGKITVYEYAAAVDALNGRMSLIKSKTVTIEVLTKYTTEGVGGGPQAKNETEFPNRYDHSEGEHAGGGSVWHWTENSHSWSLLENQYAGGGSFRIPDSYGYEGYSLGMGKTASGGETVTITPAGKGGGGGVTIQNVYINNGMDQESFKRMLMDVTR